MTLETNSLCDWIQQNASQNDAERWFPLTFRVDSVVVNAAQIAQSPWSRSPTQAFQSVLRALDWSVTELRRRHKRLPFVAWTGGSEAVGVRTHIHAIVRVPDGLEPSAFAERLEALWRRNLVKTLKTEVKATVWLDAQPLRSSTSFSHYASRSEAGELVRGTDKAHLGRSFFLEPAAT